MKIILGVISVISGSLIACGAAPENVVRSDSLKAGAASTKASAVKPADRPLTGLDSVIAAAESSYWEGEYAAARSTWTNALHDARKRADKRSEAEVLTWLGLTAWRLGEYGEARRAGEAALKIKIDEGLSGELSRSYNALGLLAWNEGRLTDAAQLFQRATTTAEAVGDEESSAKALGNQALVLTELGDFARARTGFAAARDAGRRLKNSRVEANAITNLAMLDLRAGSPLSAVSLLEHALQIYKSIEYATGEQTALAQLGAAYGALGEPARAFAALDSALASARRQGLKQDEAANLELIASFYRESGEPGRALRFYEQARVLNTELGLQLETGSVFRKEAETYAALGDIARASDRGAQALQIHRDLGVPYEELSDRLLLAELAARSGRQTEVVSQLASARRLVVRVDSRVARMNMALTNARIAERSGEFRRVTNVLHAARADLVGGGYGTEWEADALRARAYAQLGMLDSAVAATRRAVRAVERVRGKFGSGALRNAYGVERTRAYSNAVEILLRSGHVDEAFEVADAARGRALLEHLMDRSGGRATGPASHTLATGEALLRRIDELGLRLDTLEQQPRADRTEPDHLLAKQLYGDLEKARSAYEAVLIRAAELDANAASLIGSSRASAAQVRAALAPHEVLLEYLVTADKVLLLVVDRRSVRSVQMNIAPANLASRVRLARDLAAKPGSGRSDAAVLEALYADLIAPAIRAGMLRDARRLIIVPHDVIGDLSFATLRSQATGRYLMQDYALLYLPSAAALPVLRTSRTKARESTSSRASVFAPFPEGLPASIKEARAIRSALRRASLRIGSDASEAEIRRAMSGRAIVHIASHGVLNVHNPMFSRMALARGSGRTDDDGRLEVHEVLALRTGSPLIFLSGCETGAGQAWATKFSRGEDYATLAQAFLYAGADNVVGTLWRITDESGAAFASKFYKNLKSMAPPEALAEAQRDLAADPRYSAPYHWAGYQLRGNGHGPPKTQIFRWGSVL